MESIYSLSFCYLLILLYFINYIKCSSKYNSQYKHKEYKFRKRKLEDDSGPEGNNDLYFAPLSIYIDTFYFNETFPNEYNEYRDKFIKAMYNAKSILEDFLEILSDYEGEAFLAIESVPSLYETFYDSPNFYNYNFFITCNFSDFYEKTFSVVLSQYMLQPFLGLIVFSEDLINEDISKLSIDNLTLFMLHHFIRLIGFTPEVAEVTDMYIPSEDDTYYLGIVDEYMNFTSLINYAKTYFNCPRIERINLEYEVILENEEFYGTDYIVDNLYFPKRLFLGELMTKFDYQEEQILSGFTLAFLDDLPYLIVKKESKYTGGLMKFGKNKGCEFYFNECGKSDNPLTTFANEFYLPKESTINIEPSCSSGRLSKTIYKLDLIPEDELNDNDETNIIEYITSDNKGGRKSTNYCPIAQYDESIEYIGSCSNTDNTNINRQREEKYGNDSFCVISSLEKTENENPQYFPICYQMICSALSLTIKIGDNYIVCPREGGQIKAEGFQGYLLCPDYNLICTSTILCNNLFNCKEKQSKEKEESFYYDYEIKTTQNSSIYNIINPKRDYGWELAQDGTGSCPYQCMQCKSKNDCIKCRPHYNYENNICTIIIKNCIDFVDDEDDICKNCEEGYFLAESNNERYCEIETEKPHYYLYDSDLELYKKCEDSNPNCDECIYEDSKVKCKKCKNPYKEVDDGDYCGDINSQLFYEDTTGIYKSCYKHETVQNCNKCEKTSDIFNCLECEENYVLYYNSEQPSCLNKESIDNTMYTLDSKKYYSCSNSLYNDIVHCLECTKKEECQKCTSDYTITNENKLCIYTQDITDKKYYQDPEGSNYYYECSQSLENCFKCDNKYKCIECITSYIVEEKDICIPYSLYEQQLYYFDDGKYYTCSKLPNCEKCSSKNQCTKCIDGYNFIKDNSNNIICENIDTSKYYQQTEGDITYYSKCEDNINNCDECSSNNYCTKCKTNYAIIEDDHTECQNLLEEKYYYNSEFNKFSLCSNIMTNCELCSTYGEFKCKQCINNYVLKHMSETDIQCELKSFFDSNINFFHDDSELNYYSCSFFNIAKNCLECTNKDICNKCKEGYDLHNDNTLCASMIDKENNMYAYNPVGLLMTCNDLIKDCKQCYDSEKCYNCYDESVLLQDDTCLAKSIINEKNNYIIDEITNKYISCSIIDNCFSCISKTECTSCQHGFILNSNKICEKVEDNDNNKLSTGAIIGISFGCLGFLIFIAFLLYYLYKKYFNKDNINDQNNVQITEGKNNKIQENEDIEKIDINPKKEIEQNKIVIHTNRRSIHNIHNN